MAIPCVGPTMQCFLHFAPSTENDGKVIMTIVCRKTFLWAALLALLAGCGGSTDRQALQGTVTLDNGPLQQGSIRFIPQAGTGGPSAGGEIKGGRFSVEADKGVLRGSFRVEITASRKTGRKTRDRVSGEMTDIYAQFLPACYNRNSELTAEVKARGPDQFEFALHSKP